ncbi:transposase [Methanobacterium sp. SMA-27]|uniref:RNA-guided endonuclease InsQ/TnpB family protein n=1 Tax=Methanobacterium sp. SMA-27 TaxID=1495336 RepID=UPI0018CDFAFE|nr:transposase [Methanobacterium sp. SMA-27]
MKTKLHRQFKGKQQTATISMANTGKYYISILIDDEQSLPEKVKFNQKTTVGLDMGLTHFLITSNGVKVDNPHPLKTELRKLKREQRKLSHKQKGSNNLDKQRIKISKIHERI